MKDKHRFRTTQVTPAATTTEHSYPVSWHTELFPTPLPPIVERRFDIMSSLAQKFLDPLLWGTVWSEHIQYLPTPMDIGGDLFVEHYMDGTMARFV